MGVERPETLIGQGYVKLVLPATPQTRYRLRSIKLGLSAD